MSLARVTPQFLAFAQALVLDNIPDIYTKMDGYLRRTKKIAERVFLSEVQSHSTRATASEPVVVKNVGYTPTVSLINDSRRVAV